MGLDRKLLTKLIEEQKAIKASHISDERMNEMLKRSLNGSAENPSEMDIQRAMRIIYLNGYKISKGPEKGYVNSNFGYKSRMVRDEESLKNHR